MSDYAGGKGCHLRVTIKVISKEKIGNTIVRGAENAIEYKRKK